jgi:hypothetical protein
MSTIISNPSGDRNDKIANAARVLGRSEDRKKIFKAIYTGKKKIKTVGEISSISGIKNRVRVLQETKRLLSEDIIHPAKKIKNETAYQKIDFYTHNRDKILALSKNKVKLEHFPTKITPQYGRQIIKASFPGPLIDVRHVTIDDIDSFSKVRRQRKMAQHKPIYEKKFKEGLKRIIGEVGSFNDWGGETDDLYSTRLRIKGKRLSVSFGLKGKGTTGSLSPKKMGKNADQIQRLFRSPAEVFIVQYHGQIDQSVIEQMKNFAIAKSATGNQRIYFGIIDGSDTQRLMKAYPDKFK